MAEMINNFDRVAPYYDFLKKVVFGSSIRRSQVHFFSALPQAGHILVLGGGTGEIIEPLIMGGSDRRIWYIEASSEMLRRAQERIAKRPGSDITFIHGTEETLPGDVAFDGIITNFFLDLFPDRSLTDLCRKLEARLTEGGCWIVTDFANTGRWWHRMLLSIMYRFFMCTCKIKADRLPPWEDQMRLAGLGQMDCHHFYGGFIRTCVYRKVL